MMTELLLGEVGNHLKDRENRQEVDTLAQAQEKTRTAQSSQSREVVMLRGQVERQRLAIEALTRYLVNSGVVDEAKLEDFIKEVDAEDGVIDGKLALDPRTARLKLIVPPSPS